MQGRDKTPDSFKIYSRGREKQWNNRGRSDMKILFIVLLALVISGCSMYWLRGEPSYCEEHQVSYYTAEGCPECAKEAIRKGESV